MTPSKPQIFHIVHQGRIASIVKDGFLWSDAVISRRKSTSGACIGMSKIKERRLKQLCLQSHPDLFVGECVPFYFCPRSIMLYVLHKKNHPDLSYRAGQEEIVHLQFDLLETVNWARSCRRRWAFSLSNAGSCFFEDRSELDALGDLDWQAIFARDWRACREAKQAEFLVETSVPWSLVRTVGVHNDATRAFLFSSVPNLADLPGVKIRREWYY